MEIFKTTGFEREGKGNTNNFIDLTNYKLSKKNIGKNNGVKPVKKGKKIKKKKKNQVLIASMYYFHKKKN